MTGTAFAAYIRQKTKRTSTTLTDAEIVALANPIKDEIFGELLKVNEDINGIFQLRNLVVDQRNYALPPDVPQIKYLEAMLDGENWVKLTETDVQSQGIITATEDDITAYFTDKDPQFEIFGNELFIYSSQAIIDVTDGLKLWSFVFPADISTSTLASTNDLSVPPTAVTFGFPRILHKIWADKVIIEWKESQDKPIALTQDERLVDNRLKLALDSIKHLNLDRPHVPSVPVDNGENY